MVLLEAGAQTPTVSGLVLVSALDGAEAGEQTGPLSSLGSHVLVVAGSVPRFFWLAHPGVLVVAGLTPSPGELATLAVAVDVLGVLAAKEFLNLPCASAILLWERGPLGHEFSPDPLAWSHPRPRGKAFH